VLYHPVLTGGDGGKKITHQHIPQLNFLKMYSVYCGNQDLAVQTLSALKENPKAEQFLFV